MSLRLPRRLAASFLIVPLSLPLTAAQAADPTAGLPQVQESQRFSGEPDRPRRHYRIQNPADLSPQEAAAIYRDLAAELAAVYARSDDGLTARYQTWQRFNGAPYRSVTHGRRYVNNFANETARNYARYEDAGRFPEGSVVVKDSFVVTEDGEVGPGPLFVMEKMGAGFNYVTGDWRYSMISAEGKFLGQTNGPGAQRVEFCIACHLAVEDQDHLFFVPEEVRLKP